MRPKLIRIAGTTTAAACVLAAATWGAVAAGPVAPTAGPSGASLAGAVRPGLTLARDTGQAAPYSLAQCEQQYQLKCYMPDQIQQAYGLPSLYRQGITGTGATIAIVDPYGSPTLDADLATFDSAAGLPAPDLKVVEPVGHVVYHSNDPDMLAGAMETTLDVEWAHAIAPDAKIVLVAAPNDNTATVLKALLYAVQHRLGDVINLSWGSPEQDYKASQISELHALFTIAASKHVTVVASSGDTGVTGNQLQFPAPFYTYRVALWPATDPDVTAVGGTSLNLDAAGGRLSPDTVWNDTYSTAVNKFANQGGSPPSPFASGGGKSVIFTRPSYQHGVARTVGSRRGIPDISMSASCSGSVEIYHGFDFAQAGYPAGWNLVCGTSESAPLFSAIVALAVQVAGHPLGLINPAIYKLAAEHARGIVPVTSGNNTVTFIQGSKTWTVRGYYASHGYSLAVGVGTINAAYFVPELARQA